ncbi:hypothetical protein [Amycolatopsis sp. NPDC004169]|uniref:hypothetical protein n=1 Tax=Amycolatopsis sp. NPDC004169 TaxID=3154453 RepID=UPI0033B8A99A
MLRREPLDQLHLSIDQRDDVLGAGVVFDQAYYGENVGQGAERDPVVRPRTVQQRGDPVPLGLAREVVTGGPEGLQRLQR